jgi:hypothetical protein
MPGSGTGTFIDLDNYQASLHQARIDLLVTSQGSFNARLTWATLHHLQLLRSEENLPRIAYISLASTLVFVGFATRPDPPMFWGGVELRRADGAAQPRALPRTTTDMRPVLADQPNRPLPMPQRGARHLRRRCQRSCAAGGACRAGWDLRQPGRVIARNSCFTYKGHAVDVKQVGRELGVRYVLEGGLRKAGNRIRVTAQLVEAETSEQ